MSLVKGDCPRDNLDWQLSPGSVLSILAGPAKILTNKKEGQDDEENYDGCVDAIRFWLSELGSEQDVDGDG
jgi:hypothetical protein